MGPLRPPLLLALGAVGALAAEVTLHQPLEWRTVVTERHEVHSGVADTEAPLSRGLAVAYARMLQRLVEERPTLWTDLDGDGNGRRSAAELQAVIGAQATALVALADGDRSGSLDDSELADLAAGSNVDTRVLAAGADHGGSGGRRAHIFVGRQQAYVADYDSVGNQLDPVISVMGSGTVLDVADPMVTREILTP